MSEIKKPPAPRCPVCGKFMERVSSARDVVVYSCCGVEKQKVSPSQSFSCEYT